MTQPLPNGFRAILDPKTALLDGHRLLIGGSPLTAMRLAPEAAAHLRAGRVTVTDAVSAHLADRLIAANLAYPDVSSTAGTRLTDITVVVPVRDRPAQLARCLVALAPLAVIVVDDASRAPGAVAAVARRHGAQLVRLATNVGPAGARNAGLAQVSTPVVAFVDSDVEVTAAALTSLTRHLADPAVALVGPKIMGRTRSTHPRWFERYDAAASSLTLGNRPSTVRPGATVAWLPSACLIGRTALLDCGFDASLRVGEDVDLAWRLAEQGHRVRYAPEVVAGHDVRTTMRGWLGRKFVYGTGGGPLAQRHGSHIAPAVLSTNMAIAGAAVLLRNRWTAPVVAVALVSATRSVRRSLPLVVGGATRTRIAAQLAARGVGWGVRQESALLLRHWWPLTALGLRSRQVRRAVVTAVVVDTCVAILETNQPDPSLSVRLVARRLDDLAYGGGLWYGAMRGRSTRALRVRTPGRSNAPMRASDLAVGPGLAPDTW